jgi:hypothetical protein
MLHLCLCPRTVLSSLENSTRKLLRVMPKFLRSEEGIDLYCSFQAGSILCLVGMLEAMR